MSNPQWNSLHRRAKLLESRLEVIVYDLRSLHELFLHLISRLPRIISNSFLVTNHYSEQSPEVFIIGTEDKCRFPL